MADITITPASVKPSSGANPIRGVAAAAISAGDVVYVLADGTIGVADCNGTPPADVPAGIAVCSATGVGQYVMYVAADTDFTVGGTTTVGIPYFLSANPGKICLASDLGSGNKTSYIGTGKASNKMVVSIVASGQAQT